MGTRFTTALAVAFLALAGCASAHKPHCVTSMPNTEQVAHGGPGAKGYTIRLVGPASSVGSDQGVAVNTYSVLNQPNMISRPLRPQGSPGGSTWVSGQFTLRMNDAGDGQITFPNGIASTGKPWRDMFDASGHNQWIEIYNDGHLEFVGAIVQVAKNQQSVTLTLNDGVFMLKKAYARDWTFTGAPRDVIARGCQVWTPTTVDNFPAGSLNAQWTPTGSVSIGPTGGLQMGASAQVNSTTVAATNVWSASCTIQTSNLPVSATAVVALVITESTGHNYGVEIGGPNATPTAFNIGNVFGQTSVTAAPSYNLLIESDGEWVLTFVNGSLVGYARRRDATTTSLQTQIVTQGGSTTATIGSVYVKTLEPFVAH